MLLLTDKMLSPQVVLATPTPVVDKGSSPQIPLAIMLLNWRHGPHLSLVPLLLQKNRPLMVNSLATTFKQAMLKQWPVSCKTNLMVSS